MLKNQEISLFPQCKQTKKNHKIKVNANSVSASIWRYDTVKFGIYKNIINLKQSVNSFFLSTKEFPIYKWIMAMKLQPITNKHYKQQNSLQLKNQVSKKNP